MKKFKRILLDMDGVLADFHSAALRGHKFTLIDGRWPEYGKDLAYILGIAEHGATKYNTAQQERIWAPILTVSDFWLTLPKFRWTEALIRICQTFSEDVQICSSPASSWNGEDKKQKLQWLAKHRIDLPVTFESEKVRLAEPGVVLIDDWEKQVVPFQIARGHAILFPQPWNGNHALSDYPLDHVYKSLASYL